MAHGVESVVLFALDQFCLIGYSLPLDARRRAIAVHGNGLIRAGDDHQEHREHLAVAEVVFEEAFGEGGQDDGDRAVQQESLRRCGPAGASQPAPEIVEDLAESHIRTASSGCRARRHTADRCCADDRTSRRARARDVGGDVFVEVVLRAFGADSEQGCASIIRSPVRQVTSAELLESTPFG